MPRGQKDKLYRSFIKGLITEAGFLTYPEDSSTDELNTIIYRKGNRSRRLGMDFETGSNGTFLTDLSSSSVVNEYFWRSPGCKANLNYVTLQTDRIIHFFDASAVPLESGRKNFNIDLNNYAAPKATLEQIRTNSVSMVGGKGYLFVVGEFIDPLTVVYDPLTDDITVTRINLMIRDFDGVNDGLPNDAEPASLSHEHLYNLRNQGWVPPGSTSVQGTIPGSGVSSDGAGGGSSGGGVSGGNSSGSQGGSSGYWDPYEGNFKPNLPDGVGVQQ